MPMQRITPARRLQLQRLDLQREPTVMRNGLGVAALSAGVIAVFVGFWIWPVGGMILGIVAVILGLVGRSRVKRSQANNGGVAAAGIVLGVVVIIMAVGYFAWLFNRADLPRYRECLNNAGADKAKQDQCDNEIDLRIAYRPKINL